MFRFFKKKKKAAKRDLFQELFPLTSSTKQQIKTAVEKIQTQMHGEDGMAEISAYRRHYDSKMVSLNSLEFDSFNWKLHEATETSVVYYNDFGDSLDLAMIPPNGVMVKETASSEMPVFRDWMRNNGVNQGGGLIFCEEFDLNNGTTGSESILKLPKEEGLGMNYLYSLNVHHYEEQKLYQIVIRVPEASPTGMRDNVFMQPISSVLTLDMMELAELYRQDPYDKDFKGGNTMNLSERAEFDDLFPFHPLSIIRNEIAPQLKSSLKFLR
jgi:hypothetical protein